MTKLKVPEMSCGHCKSAVEKAVASVDVDLESRTVSIQSSVTDSALIDALKEGGYEASIA